MPAFPAARPRHPDSQPPITRAVASLSGPASRQAGLEAAAKEADRCPATFVRAVARPPELPRDEAVSHTSKPQETTMNWDTAAGNWKTLKGKFKEQWGKLTDDDL